MIQRIFLALFLLCFIQAPLSYAEYQQNKVPLKATRNTRDLAGIKVDGGEFREGLLYRSGALCFLTREDVGVVQGLELATVIDLRTLKEIRKDGKDRSGVRDTLKDKTYYYAMHNSQGLGQEAYHYYMRENEELFRWFFHFLAQEENYPILFHCSAGKDRTGILTALLLESLGTPRSVITEDYLASQKNSPGLVVKEPWLGEVYARIDQYGGIEGYLEHLNISRQTLEQIRRNLIQP